jgi:hypothetical protein
MIGHEAIKAAMTSGRCSPTNDETLGVDTEALRTVAREYGYWAAVADAMLPPGGLPEKLAASFAQGFMAGVVAEQERTDGRPGA